MDLVTITIDERQIKVPKGMNLIEAAKLAGIDVPHYCYHPNLSIAGNCRMCQVQVEGQPKLTIACNTGAVEGMKVRTHLSAPSVAEAQRATLEFLLINHPLDCTVCDQAGHCKLQDYYYDYDTKPSRFIEDKVHKVKAEDLGPEVIYDGERCIVCTRCARFCEEVPGTNELGVFNRGDRAVIGAYPGHELTNPFSGTVVDLCPVGALTHRRWRFNTRIWYTEEASSVCNGCSTGCNVQVFTRDDQVVHVKARLNGAVNKEWMCDEGRYGFERFQPSTRLADAMQLGKDGFERRTLKQLEPDLKKLGGTSAGDAAIFLSPFLTLEEISVALQFAAKVMGVAASSEGTALRVTPRPLTDVEAKLISPDRAPNARAAAILGISGGENWREAADKKYNALLDRVRSGAIKRILTVGDLAIAEKDLNEPLLRGLSGAAISVALTPRGVAENTGSAESGAFNNRAHLHHQILLPTTTINEKGGVLVNRDGRFQRLRAILQAPFGTLPEWQLLDRMAKICGKTLLPSVTTDERSLFSWMTSTYPELSKLTLQAIGTLGVTLEELSAPPPPPVQAEQAAAAPA